MLVTKPSLFLRQHVRWLASAFVAASMFLLVYFGYGYYQFGSPHLAWNYLVGREVVTSIEEGNFGSNELTLSIRNLGNKTISILGLEAACQCVIHPTKSFPVTLNQGELYSIPVDAKALQEGDRTDWHFVWYTSHPTYQRIPVIVRLDSNKQLDSTKQPDSTKSTRN
jgi:hypothetical protein